MATPDRRMMGQGMRRRMGEPMSHLAMSGEPDGDDKPIRTADRQYVGTGDRVFDYYDGHWGTIGKIDEHSQEPGGQWFDHHREDGTGRGYLNGERVTTRIPRGNPFYESHGAGNPS